ncbi:MAG: hypothetical protein QNJ46_13165 [Leptolyngbyaceae cyanobacterium MO_188.B28]|nr:hypothetical protein [Leptolyngbyaceae cyanobacterium MO_188.B28]
MGGWDVIFLRILKVIHQRGELLANWMLLANIAICPGVQLVDSVSAT